MKIIDQSKSLKDLRFKSCESHDTAYIVAITAIVLLLIDFGVI